MAGLNTPLSILNVLISWRELFLFHDMSVVQLIVDTPPVPSPACWLMWPGGEAGLVPILALTSNTINGTERMNDTDISCQAWLSLGMSGNDLTSRWTFWRGEVYIYSGICLCLADLHVKTLGARYAGSYVSWSPPPYKCWGTKTNRIMWRWIIMTESVPKYNCVVQRFNY